MWEGARKGALKIVCLLKLVSLLRLTVVPFCSRELKLSNNKKFHQKRVPISIGCWNVRTLLDRVGSGRPERRTALVTDEFKRLNLDIIALSETRFSGEDQISEVSSGILYSDVVNLLVLEGMEELALQ